MTITKVGFPFSHPTLSPKANWAPNSPNNDTLRRGSDQARRQAMETAGMALTGQIVRVSPVRDSPERIY